MSFDPNAHIIQLRGKGGAADYLPVAARIAWFRDKHPDGHIAIAAHTISEQIAIFHARVSIPEGGSAEGWGSETPRDFGDYIEKASTKALGRALLALGFGTMQAGEELDEGARIADAPVERAQPRPAPAPLSGNGSRIAYNDPRHSTPYSPRQQVRDELAARQAPAPLPPKAFESAINQAWTALEDGKDEGSIFDTLAALEPRMSEEQRLVRIQQETALREELAARRKAVPQPAGVAG